MNAINLYKLTRVNDDKLFELFEKQLSGRESIHKVKTHEKDCIIALVDALIEDGAGYSSFEGFYYAYDIPQIGKEFDLLRISDNLLLNIELKSECVSIEKIENQLRKNKYYLSHLSLPTNLFTVVNDTGTIYRLTDGGHIVEDCIQTITSLLKQQMGCMCSDINRSFKVSDFLVSPLNTPERFLRKEYFLTPQQEDFKKRIIKEIANTTKCKFIGIEGGPGTGKTLLLYDLAIQCGTMGKCCIIHCGMLSSGHGVIRRAQKAVDIIPAKNISPSYDFSKYAFVFVDESHRFYEAQFDLLIEQTQKLKLVTVFSYDRNQTLSKRERRSDIASKIADLPYLSTCKLTNKIRTNKELASFIRRLLNLNSTDRLSSYPSVSLSYANNKKETNRLLKQYEKDGYEFISFTKSNYKNGTFDSFIGDQNTHEVIGQEFDKVVMLMDSTFYYDDRGRLVGGRHPNPDYLYRQLLFQGLSRVREQLGLIIINDKDLFLKILSIVNNIED